MSLEVWEMLCVAPTWPQSAPYILHLHVSMSWHSITTCWDTPPGPGDRGASCPRSVSRSAGPPDSWSSSPGARSPARPCHTEHTWGQCTAVGKWMTMILEIPVFTLLHDENITERIAVLCIGHWNLLAVGKVEYLPNIGVGLRDVTTSWLELRSQAL